MTRGCWVIASPRPPAPPARRDPGAAGRVIHSRHYTVEEADAAISDVAERLERLRAARVDLGDEEARDALSGAAPGNGGGQPGRVVSEAFLALRNGLLELQEMGVVLRDLERGLVDFPALRDGVEIYLCWEEGEEEIGHWHEVDTGFAGRRPLDDG
jgi:Uncharacterized conserved protein (DUF2203)